VSVDKGDVSALTISVMAVVGSESRVCVCAHQVGFNIELSLLPN